METSKTLKGFRAKNLLSQEDLAVKLGVSRQTYNTYENNPLSCDLESLMKIFDTLNIKEVEFKEFLYALEQDYKSYSKKEMEE